MARIRLGDSKQQIRALLGDPSDGSSATQWYYERLLNPGWVTVGFDAEDRVIFVDDEQLFP